MLSKHSTSGQTGALQGAYAGIVAKLQSNTASRQQRAAEDVSHLALLSSSIRLAITATGAVPLLFALLRSDQPAAQYQAATGCSDVLICANIAVLQLRTAASALRTLADSSKKLEDAIIVAGAVPLLVALLRSEQPTVQEQAAAALRRLAFGSQQTKDAVLAAGALPWLVEDETATVQGAAAGTLSSVPG
ncbi:hypothetical protein ABBQ32_012348 [Trebouxia sp. C0010 RCD-2024]